MQVAQEVRKVVLAEVVLVRLVLLAVRLVAATAAMV